MKPTFELVRNLEFSDRHGIVNYYQGEQVIFLGFRFHSNVFGLLPSNIKCNFLMNVGRQERILMLTEVKPLNDEANRVVELYAKLLAQWQILRSEIVDRVDAEIEEYNKQIEGM